LIESKVAAINEDGFSHAMAVASLAESGVGTGCFGSNFSRSEDYCDRTNFPRKKYTPLPIDDFVIAVDCSRNPPVRRAFLSSATADRFVINNSGS
jgi:hypothetical protein